MTEQTSHYGEVFEHFIILQCTQLASYFHREYRFSYLATKDGAEIDLVVERPGRKTVFIEIKSTKHVESHHLTNLRVMAKDHGNCEAVCFSRDSFRRQIDGVTIFPWYEGVKEYFTTQV